MPKTRAPYAAEFRQQMVDLVRSGRARAPRREQLPVASRSAVRCPPTLETPGRRTVERFLEFFAAGIANRLGGPPPTRSPGALEAPAGPSPLRAGHQDGGAFVGGEAAGLAAAGASVGSLGAAEAFESLAGRASRRAVPLRLHRRGAVGRDSARPFLGGWALSRRGHRLSLRKDAAQPQAVPLCRTPTTCRQTAKT